MLDINFKKKTQPVNNIAAHCLVIKLFSSHEFSGFNISLMYWLH